MFITARRTYNKPQIANPINSVTIPLTRPLKNPEVFQLSDISKMLITRMGTQKKRTRTISNQRMNHHTAFTGSAGIFQGGISCLSRLIPILLTLALLCAFFSLLYFICSLYVRIIPPNAEKGSLLRVKTIALRALHL